MQAKPSRRPCAPFLLPPLRPPPFTCSIPNDGALVASFLHGQYAEDRDAYESDVAHFRIAVGKPLADVTDADVRAYVGSLAEDGVALSTRIQKMRAVHELFEFARRQGFTSRNPAASLVTPRRRSLLEEVKP